MPSIATLLLAALAAMQAVNAAPQGISHTARCGAPHGLVCTGSDFGNCCSQNGWCGSSEDYCGEGCQSGFGSCDSDEQDVTPIDLEVSENGACGQNDGTTCLGSLFGNCCSRWGYCGSDSDYCGEGCNPLYGDCDGTEPGETEPEETEPEETEPEETEPGETDPTPSIDLPVSLDARCGTSDDQSGEVQTCLGSVFGNCCSAYGWCGSSEDHCGEGCNPLFGDCEQGSVTPPVESSEPAPEGTPEPSPKPAPEATPEPTPEVIVPSTTPEASPEASPEPAPEASPEASPEPAPEATPEPTPEVIIIVPTPEVIVPSPTPEVVIPEATPEPAPEASPEPSPEPAPEATPEPTPEVIVPTPSPEVVVPTPTPEVVVPTPREPICGQKIYPTDDSSYYDVTEDQTLDQCYAICRSEAQCQFVIFVYDNQCWRFNQPFDVDAGGIDFDTVVLYEKACFSD